MKADLNKNIQVKPNPEIFNQPIFHNNRIKQSSNNKPKVTYYNIDQYVQKKHKLICTTDQQFLKTTSCLSSSQKYDVVGDILDNSTYNLRRSQKNNKINFRKRSKENRSASNKLIIFTPQAEQRLIGKITIHSLKAQRSVLQQECKQVDSQYRYVLKKFNDFKKAKFLEESKEKKIQKIICQKRKLSQDLLKHSRKQLQIEKKYKENAKKDILKHRVSKNKSILKKKTQNNISASKQRQFQEQMRQMIQDSAWQQYNKNRKKFQYQKIAEEQRKKNIANKIQAKKLQARSQFRNRWLRQLQKTQSVKDQMIIKKQQIQYKIKEVLQNWARDYRKKQI